jgi:hypothetical protein
MAMSDAMTVLFGLPGAQVARVDRCADGTRVVDVGHRRADGGGVPVVRGGVDIGEGPRGYLTERYPLWRRRYSSLAAASA